jgi:hypothetical protein
MIEAFLAARQECGPNGFFLWGGLIRVDGTVTWTAADCVGRGPSCSVVAAQHTGVVEVLKQLHELRKKNRGVSIALFVDQTLFDDIKGEWPQSVRPSASLDEARNLVRGLWPFRLGFCSRNGLLAPHSLITELCKRNGVR